jgi:hypothetical protein
MRRDLGATFSSFKVDEEVRAMRGLRRRPFDYRETGDGSRFLQFCQPFLCRASRQVEFASQRNDGQASIPAKEGEKSLVFLIYAGHHSPAFRRIFRRFA